MKFKFFTLITLLLLLSLSLFACGGGSGDPEDDGSSQQPGDNDDDNDVQQPDDSPAEFTITWVDENGATIATTTVEEGDIPSYSYSKADTAEWDYTFVGWCNSANGAALNSIPAASANATYYAKISATKQTYNASFNSNGGSDVATQTIEYGSVASLPEAPEREGHRFLGWYTDSTLKAPADFTKPITGNVTFYASWLEKVDVASLLKQLVNGATVSPYSYIPESMLPGANALKAGAVTDASAYNSFVNVSSIPGGGHGEQWRMVLDNLAEAQLFYNVLSTADGITSTAIAIFNNYFDSVPSNTASYSFETGIYNVTIDFDGEDLYYVLDFTANIASLGEQSAQIAMYMDVDSGEKTVRIQLGEANAISYVVADDYYEFAIKYLGIRRAYLKLNKTADGKVSGSICEYLTVSSIELRSAAEFYADGNYVSVVGNKASGMVGFTGHICELYNASSGKMIGYEVKETLSSITYNTIWLDLNQISGINSIKYVKGEAGASNSVYLNGLSDKFEAKKVGGFSLNSLSRRYDIELRTQYHYYYDAASEEYCVVAVEVPMLFLQQEYLSSFTDDVEDKNDDLDLSVSASSIDILKLVSDYEVMIPAFIEKADFITVDIILEFIGEKVVFENN